MKSSIFQECLIRLVDSGTDEVKNLYTKLESLLQIMLNICHDELRTSLLHPDQKITAGDRNLWLDLRNQIFHLMLKHSPTKDELFFADLAETIMQIMDQGDISIQKIFIQFFQYF